MKYLIYFFTIVLLVGVNVGIFSNFRIFAATPNLLLLLVIINCLERDNEDYLFLSMVSGLFLDFYSGAFPGSFTLAFLASGLLIKFFLRNILMLGSGLKSLLIVLIIAVFFTALFIRLYGALVCKIHWSGQLIGFEGFFGKIAAEFVYDCILLYPMLYLARFLRFVNDDLLAKNRKMP